MLSQQQVKATKHQLFSAYKHAELTGMFSHVRPFWERNSTGSDLQQQVAYWYHLFNYEMYGSEL